MPKPPDKKSNLGDLLLLFRRNILDSVNKKGLKPDLTFSQLEILHFIGISGEKTMKSIADYLKVTPPSVTELVREMEVKNLVKRINDQRDRRIVFVVLTAATRKNYISISKKKDLILNQMAAKLNSKEKKTLERLIKKITAQ